MVSLYIHIPYCVKKCPYCGFYSTPYEEEEADAFISALRAEASGYHPDFRNRTFRTVYVGGGTPTVLSLEQIRGIGRIIADNFRVTDSAEFTVEANPNSVSERTLAAWQEAGANRLSLGVQSFSDDVLRILGRLHTGAQASSAFRLARQAGFLSIGMDLIYGVPGQTALQWEESLEKAVACGPEHLSLYGLSLDDGSAFKQDVEEGRLAAPDDDSAADQYEAALAALRRAGYPRYEISNFSLPGFACLHNMNYWERGEYLGLGPGAWSFLRGRRCHAIADAPEYTRRLSNGIPVVTGAELVGPEPARQETLLLNLRTMKGMELRCFEKEHGPRSLQRLERNMAPLVEAGLLRLRGGRVSLTDRGILLSNEVLARLTG
jgi:oxygen-independent coproporphyrinogen-3 oxidase